MLIVLDTNIVYRDPLLRGRPFEILSKLAKRAGNVEVTIPEVVLAELKRQIGNAANNQIVRVKASNKFWRGLGDHTNCQVEPDAEQLTHDWFDALQKQMQFLGFTSIATPMNEDRLIARFKRAGRPLKRQETPRSKTDPSTDDEPWVKGLGDVLLWESVLHELEGRDVFLVSDDRKAFADGKAPADPNTGLTPIASELKREVAALAGSRELFYCRNLAELHTALIELNFVEDRHLKAAIIENAYSSDAFQEEVLDLVIEAIREAAGPNVSGADVDWPRIGPAELAADPDVQHVGVIGSLTFGDVVEIDTDDYAIGFTGTAEADVYLWAHVFSVLFAFDDEFPPAVSFDGYDTDASVTEGEWHGQVGFDGTLYFTVDGAGDVNLNGAELQSLQDLMPNADPKPRDDRGKPIEDEF